VRPTITELQAVREDPKVIEGLVDGYLHAAEFGAMIRDLENQSLIMRWEAYQFPPTGTLSGETAFRINRSVFEAPMRLIEHVVVNDQPYTDILTADYTIGDPIVATIWTGLEPYDPDGEEWQPLHFTDGRPAAGIMADGSFYVRFITSRVNVHRRRANQLTKALLCYDFLTQDIILDSFVDLTDPESVENAVVNNDKCASCHQALDPIAATFWIFRPGVAATSLNYPLRIYFPGAMFSDIRPDREPGYFGASIDGDGSAGFESLMQHVVDDPRFSLCTAKRYYGYLTQTPIEQVPTAIAASLQRTLLDSGFNIRELARAIVLSPEFRQEDVQKTRPEQIDRMFADLTGFRWQTELGPLIGRIDLSNSDHRGYRLLAGGIDSSYVRRPLHTTNATTSLFIRGLAREAANYVVHRDFAEADSAKRKLLRKVEQVDRDEAQVRLQLAELHLRLYAESVASDAVEVDESWGLFAAALAATDDVPQAWITTLTGMFQSWRIMHF
ncbi:MAG: hypothetical protein VB934_13470, partial [Polyangiaceae bacterium]